MPYEVSFNVPNLAEGAVALLPGFGEIKNGGSITVSDDEAAAYEYMFGVDHEPAYAEVDGEQVQVGMQQTHKTFSELMEGFSGLSVKETGSPVEYVTEETVADNTNSGGLPDLRLPTGDASDHIDTQGVTE